MYHAYRERETPIPRPAGELRIPMSYEEYVAFESPTGGLVEWVNGEAIVFMAPTDEHQQISGLIYTVVHMYVKTTNIGEARIAPLEMHHLPNASREPDILTILNQHTHRITPERVIGPADVVFEVVSPESIRRDYTTKRDEYETSGVQEYWIVDPRPKKQSVLLYVASNIQKYYQIFPDQNGYYHSVLIPGFWINPSWFWQSPLPLVQDILHEIAPNLLLDKDALREAERKGMQIGREEGLSEGLSKGRVEGLSKGRVEGLLMGIEMNLEGKFGVQGLALVSEIATIQDMSTLKAIHTATLTAQTIEDVRSLYQNTANGDVET